MTRTKEIDKCQLLNGFFRMRRKKQPTPKR